MQPRLDGSAGAERRSQSIREQISVCVLDIRGGIITAPRRWPAGS